MSRLRLCLLFVVLVPVFNLLTVLALPTLINRLVLHRIVSQGLANASQPDLQKVVMADKAEVLARGGINIALPAPRADASARTVVRPSPDLLYTACVFDLSKGPLHISAPVPDSYASVSGFAGDSSNFFAINDASATTDANGQRRFDLLLSLKPDTPVPPGAQLVIAPDARGLVLFRTLIADDSRLPALQAEIQAQQRCDPI